MNQKDKEQKRNCPATLEGKIWSSQMNVTWKYKPFLLSLAPSFISEKNVFTIGAEIWLAACIYISLLQNECNLFGFQQWRKGQKWWLLSKVKLKTTISGAQKAEWVTGRGHLLAKLIKSNAGLNELPAPVKTSLASGQHLQAPAVWERKEAIRNGGTAQVCWFTRTQLPWLARSAGRRWSPLPM